jgi:hypothetical protein
MVIKSADACAVRYSVTGWGEKCPSPLRCDGRSAAMRAWHT